MNKIEQPHVLIIDDEKGILRVFAEILAIDGYKTTTFTSGHSALDFLESGESVNVILSDIKMPSMDGIELTRKINSICPEIPVILMTGHMHAASKEIEELNVQKVIFKPLDWQDLISEIEKAITSAENQVLS